MCLDQNLSVEKSLMIAVPGTLILPNTGFPTSTQNILGLPPGHSQQEIYQRFPCMYLAGGGGTWKISVRFFFRYTRIYVPNSSPYYWVLSEEWHPSSSGGTYTVLKVTASHHHPDLQNPASSVPAPSSAHHPGSSCTLQSPYICWGTIWIFGSSISAWCQQ